MADTIFTGKKTDEAFGWIISPLAPTNLRQGYQTWLLYKNYKYIFTGLMAFKNCGKSTYTNEPYEFLISNKYIGPVGRNNTGPYYPIKEIVLDYLEFAIFCSSDYNPPIKIDKSNCQMNNVLIKTTRIPSKITTTKNPSITKRPQSKSPSISADISIVIAIALFAFIIGILYKYPTICSCTSSSNDGITNNIHGNFSQSNISPSAPASEPVSVSVSEPASAPTAYGSATPTFNIHSNSFIPEDDPPSYEEPPTYAESILLKYGKF